MKHTWKRLTAAAVCVALLLAMMPAAWAQSIQGVADLTVNYQTEPMALDGSDIRFGWKLQSNVIGAAQSAYEIVVSDGDAVVWNSGKVISDQSVAVPYGGDALNLETVYTWQVTVWDQDGNAVKSGETRFATGCDFSDASWIIPVDAAGDGVVMLRKEQALSGQVRSAHLYMTSLGIYTASINGKEVKQELDGKVMDDLFAPGWTDYTDYVNYQGYDVTEYMQEDSLCLGIELGKGWYAGNIGTYAHYEGIIGDGETRELAAIAKLIVTYEDGSRQVICTDESWTSSSAHPVTFNDFYAGEHYNALLEAAVEGWNTVGYDDSGWTAVTEGTYTPGDLRPSTKASAYFDEANALSVVGAYTYDPNAPVEGEVTETYRGAVVKTAVDHTKPITLKAGQTLVLDMGVNTAAVMEMTMEGDAGTVVTLRHAEILNDGQYCADGSRVSDGAAGTLHLQALGTGTAVDTYTMAGGSAVYRPAFTYHGYRYVEVTATADVVIHSARSIPVTSSVDQTGFLETSHAGVNQLIANALNSHRSNFTTLPTDCPQRQERWGWTGDIQLYSETAVYNYDSVAILENYLEILNETAPRFGNVYGAVVPLYQDGLATMLTCGWSDVGVLLPWVLYQQTGDEAYIETYYDQMDLYMQKVYQQGYNGFMFGDWYASCGTSTVCMNALYEYHVTSIMAKISQILGKNDKADAYKQKLTELKNTYLNKFYNEAGDLLSSSTPDGQTASFHGNPVIDNAQSGLLWSLKLGLYRDETHKAYLLEKLVENIRNENGAVRPNDQEDTLSVGFLGVNVLLPVLTEVGAEDVAFDLMMQEESPSWLYEVKVGATSVWESWKAYDPDQGISSSGASFNHFSYGACLEWMYEYMAGIQKDEANPGFKNTILQPTVDAENRLDYVRGSYDSYYGVIESNWTAKDGRLATYEAVVPANTTATLYLPVETAEVALNTSGVTYVGEAEHHGESCAVFQLAAGGYTFTVADGVITAETAAGYVDTGVVLNLTGESTATVDVETLTYTVSVTGADRLATATLSLAVEKLENPAVEALNGWYIIAESYEDGVLNVVMGNHAGTTSENAVDILRVEASTSGQVGTVSVSFKEATLSAYTVDSEKFVNVIYGQASVETVIDYSVYDVNRDGVVNQLDITRAQRSYGMGEGDGGWNALADVNGDKQVDINDLILILNNYTFA